MKRTRDKNPAAKNAAPAKETKTTTTSQKANRYDPVDETSDESFPASDPPSWTSTSATRDGERD